MGAMIASSPEIVSMLLDNGADPLSTDINGIDNLQYATASGAYQDRVQS